MAKVNATVPTRVLLKMMPPEVGDAAGWAVKAGLPNRMTAKGLEEAIVELSERPFDGVVTAALAEQLKLVANNLRQQDAARALAEAALAAPRDGEALTDVAGTRDAAPAAAPADVVQWQPIGPLNKARKLELFEKQGFTGPLAQKAVDLGLSLKLAGTLARAGVDRAGALDALEHGVPEEDLLAWHEAGVPAGEVARLVAVGMTVETWVEQRARRKVDASRVAGLIDEGIAQYDWPSAQVLMGAGLSPGEVKQFLALDVPVQPGIKNVANISATNLSEIRAKIFDNVARAIAETKLTVPELLKWTEAGVFDTRLGTTHFPDPKNPEIIGIEYAKMGLTFEQASAAASFTASSVYLKMAQAAGYSIDEFLDFNRAGFAKVFNNTRFYLDQLGTFAKAGFSAAQVIEAYPLELEVDDVAGLSKAGCTADEILQLAHAGRADARSFNDDYLSLGLTPSEAVAEILSE
ncbi:MAG: hypothetical protein IPJ65_27175 [Archangiaceae bacterium]|nr:hypothetical protein [Archangiaceae bacterium]